ncbi:ESPR-type extended signal peptide-containing protein [Variovorax sp. DAIF25]|uniref:ESPR-type extended signal peptide-containing protein n=1 Tax=Variovorax sp. DAIF25 TaxID=3080983 RepID=UPI003D6BC13C
MNKTYRSVWNEALGAWVAASETVKARGKGGGRVRAAVLAAGLAAVTALGAGDAWAQAGIHDGTGHANPDPVPGAVLDINSSTRGVMMPRVALTDATVWGLPGGVPADGMVLFNTTPGTAANGLTQGLVTWKGGRWVSVDETPYLHVNATAAGNSTLANSGATGANSVAIGPDAKASAGDTVAMGNGTEARKLGDIAIGRGALASGGNNLNSPTENWSSVALGAYAAATESNSVAVGGSAKAEGRGTALGSRAEAGYDTVAVGMYAGMSRPAKSDPNDFSNAFNTFVGSGAGVAGSGARNAYVGNQAGAIVTGDENVGMGFGAGGLTTGNRNIALGQRAGQVVTGDQNIHQGTLAGLQSTGSNNIALGTGAGANLALAAQDPNSPIPQAVVQAASLAAQNEFMGFLASRGVTQAGIDDGSYTIDGAGNVVQASSGNVVVTAAELQDSFVRASQRNGVAGTNASRTTAIGYLSRATGDDALAIGSSAVAGEKAAVAIGSGSQASGVSAVAIGTGAQANGTQSISIGTGNVVNGDHSGAIGDPNTISGNNSYAVGNHNTIAASSSHAQGNNNALTDATGSYLFANGEQNSVSGSGNYGAIVSGGLNAIAGNTNEYNQLIGYQNELSGNDNQSTSQIGRNNSITGDGNRLVSVIGNQNALTGKNDNTSVLGTVNTLDGTSLTSVIGANNKVGATSATSVIGKGLSVTGGEKNFVGGVDTTLNGLSSSVVLADGGQVADNASGVVLLGKGAQAGASDTVAVGTGATAAYANTVALGANSTTSKDLVTLNANAAYVPPGAASVAGALPVGEVSVGSAGAERRVTNVAAGAVDTDAVNVSQLKAATTHYYSVNDNGVTGGNHGNDGATGLNALAAGVDAAAAGDHATAVGSGAQAAGAGSTAVGVGAGQGTPGASNTAVGASAGASVTGSENAAFGSGAGTGVTGEANTSLGTSAGVDVQGDRNTFVGNDSGTGAKGTRNVAVGNNAGDSIDGNDNLGLGSSAGNGVQGNRNVGVGTVAGSVVTGTDNAALGTGAVSLVKGSGNVGVGQGAGGVVDGDNNVSIGRGAGTAAMLDLDRGGYVDRSGNLLAGQPAATKANDTVSIGNLAYASKDRAIAVGKGTEASGLEAVAMGPGAQANGDESLSVGPNAGRGSSGAYNAAFGTKAGQNVTGTSNVALGGNAGNGVAGDFNLGVGEGAGTRTEGSYNAAQGHYAGTDIKGNANLSAGFYAGLGTQGDNNVALGRMAGVNVEASDTVSIGSSAVAGKDGAVAVGREAQASAADGVALGAGSQATQDAAALALKNAYAPDGAAVAGSAPVGEVSVGSAGKERRITNLAAGADDTDAVNVSQLKAAQTHYYSVNDNGTPQGNHDNSGATGINSLAAGVNAAATADQSVAVGVSSVASGGGGVAVGNSSQALGQQTTAIGGNAGNGVTGGDYATYVGTSAGAASKGASNTYVGSSAGLGATGNYNATLGTTSGYKLAGDYNTIVGTSAGLSTQGDRNVAVGTFAGMNLQGSDNHVAGSAAGFALQGDNNVAVGTSAGTGYFIDTKTGLLTDRNGNKVAGTPPRTVLNDTVAVGNHAITDSDRSIALGKRAIAGASGRTDAIAIGTGAQALGASSISIGTGNVVSGDNSGAIGDPNIVSGSGSYAVGNNNDIAANNAFAVGNNVVIAAGLDGAVGIGNGSTVSAATVASYAPNGAAVAGTATGSNVVSVGASGAERRLTNVAAGGADTDAVNVSQLKAAQTHYYSVNDNGTPGDNYDNKGATGTNALAAGVGAAAKANDGVAVGASAVADGTSGGSVAIGRGASAFTSSGGAVNHGATAIGSGATASFSNSTALGGDASALASEATSLGAGSSAGTNAVAAGFQAKAANGGAAIGFNATTVGTAAVAVGPGATGTGLASVSVGSNTDAQGVGAVTVGAASRAFQDGSTALGVRASAALADSVALGSNSLANTAAGVVGYDPSTGTAAKSGTAIADTTSTLAAVSVGGNGQLRQITNVAAGAADSDAVNVSQLKAVSQVANAGWNVAANGEATGGNVAPGGKVDFGNSDGNVTITRTGTDLDVKLADDVKVNNSVTVGQSVLDTTGLTVNNGTTTTAVSAGGVTSGTVNLSGVSNDIQGLSNKTLTDPSFATVGRAATEEQLKLVDQTANAGWNVTANGAGSSTANIGPNGKVTFNGDSNMTVTQTGAANDGQVNVALNKDVNLTAAGSLSTGNSRVDNAGLTVNNGTTTTAVSAGGVTSGTVKLSGVTNDIQGLSNKTLTDPSFATVGRAATEEQLKLVDQTANAGWNVAANGEVTGANVAPGGKVDFSNSDGNVTITRTGTNLDVKLADDVKVNNSVTVGQSVVNTTGLTVNNGTTTTAVSAGGVTSGTVSLSGVTNDVQGLSNKTLTDPSFATVGRAATEEQLKLVDQTANAGWNVAANGEATGGNVAPGGKVNFGNSDGNVTIQRTGTDLNFKLADDVKVNNSVTVGQSVVNTTGLTVNNGTTTTVVSAGGVSSGTVKLSGVTNDIQGLSNKTLTDPTFATVGRAATEEQLKIVDQTANAGWNVAANGEATGANVAPGGKVDFSNSDGNVTITRTGTNLDVKLADDVKVNNSVTVGQSVVNTTGLTVNNGTTTTAVSAGGVTSGTVSLSGVTNDIQGLSNKTLTDPSFATVGRAATEEQLKIVDQTANAGWNVAANGEATGANVAPGGKVDFSNSDSNVTITRTGTNLDVKLADDVKVNNSVTVGQSVVNTTGLTVNNGTTTTAVSASGVTSGTVSLSGVTNDIQGLSNKTLTDPTFATLGRAATEEQLKLVDQTANAGWNVAANGEATGANVAPGGKVDFSNSDSNVTITRTGTNLDVKLADDVKVNNSVTVGQSVVNTTGLTVNNGTTTTAVSAGGVTSGTINLSGVTNDVQGLSNKTLTDPSFATVGRAATEEQLKLVEQTANAGWNVAANGEATGANVAPGGKVDFSNSDGNITITRTGTNLDVKLADDVKVNNSVTVGQSVVNTTGLTVNNGTSTTAVSAGGVTSGTVNLSGVTNDIQGLSNKTLTDPTFATVGRAATEEQLKLVDQTASAGWNVAANGEATGGNVAPGGKVDFSNSDGNVTIKRTGTNLDVKLADDVKVNNSVTVGQSVVNTTGLTVNNGTTTTAVSAGGVTSGTVNLSGVTNDIQGLSNKTLTDPSFATVGRAATEEQLKLVDQTASAGWNVAANGEATGGNVAPGGKVDFSNSDGNVTIKRTGTNLDVKLADDVKVNNSVTVGQSVLNTTGLTVNNGTTTTAVSAGGVTSGTVNLSGVTNDIQGLSNKTLTDPTFATVGRAATEEQLKLVDQTAGAGWNVAANGEATGGNVAPGGKVDFSNSDGNVTITRTGTNLDVKLADDVKVNNSVTVGQSVMNTTGLTVADGTTTTAVSAGGVTSGTVNLSGVTNDIKGLSNKTLTDPTFATVGRAATEEQLKLVDQTANAGWNVAANGETTGGNVAPGGKVNFGNSDGNIAIQRTGTDLDFKLADDVKVNNSLTVGQSVVNTTGLTVNNGTTTTVVSAGGVTSGTVNLSGVTNDIQGLSNKTLTDPTFATVGRAATEEQLKLVDQTASAGWSVTANGAGSTTANIGPNGKVTFNGDSNMTVTQNGVANDGQVKVALNKDVNLTAAGSLNTGNSLVNNAGLTVNDGTTTTAVSAGGVSSGTVKLSGVTNDIQGLSNKTLTDPTFATVGRAATEEQLKLVDQTANAGWNVAANGEATGGNVAPGGKVNFGNSDGNVTIQRTGTDLDFKLADDVKVNSSVTVGQSVVNTTGLTVNNGTTTTAVSAGGVTSGTVKLSGVSNDIQGLSNKTLTDPTFATVGRAATEEQLKLVDQTASAGWNVAANGEATGGNVAPGGKVNFGSSDGNVAIQRTGTDLDFKLADDVKVNHSVTVGDTVMNNAGVAVGPDVKLGSSGLTIAGGPSVTTSGIDAGGKVITNVAPGVADTDAVNVSQLNDTVDKGKTRYYSVNSTGGGNAQNDGATGADAIASGKDAKAAGDNAVAMGTAAQATGASATALGNAAWALGDRGSAVGYFSTAGGIDSTAFGAWSRALGNGSVAAGAASTAAGTASVAVGAGSTAAADGGVALGALSVADRAAGAAGYVPPGADTASSKAIASTTATAGAVGVGDAANGLLRQITGVAAGSALTDAVNVAQLQAVASQAASAGNKWITGSPTTYVAPTSSGKDGTAVGSGAVVKADRGVAIGTGAVVSTDNSVALGNDSTTSKARPTEEVTIQGTTYKFAGAKPVGVVSVGSEGKERQITNVAAGEISATSTDAVNGSQLYATNQAINNIQTGSGIKYFHANSQAADSNAAGAESVAIGPRAEALGHSAVATGNGARAIGAGSLALGGNSLASSSNGVALGNGAVADRAGMNGQREMFSGVAVASAQGALSVGASGNERQITNVAGGTQATDAVNVRQLQAVQQSTVRYDTNPDGSVNYNSVTMGNGASSGPVTIQNVAPGVAPTDAVNVQQLNQSSAANNAYTDMRANALGNEIRSVARNAYAGVAAAMAVQMPGSYVPGKTVMRMGYGVFKGESAMGVSFRRTAESNAWSLTGGVGLSRAGASATVGAEWVFN